MSIQVMLRGVVVDEPEVIEAGPDREFMASIPFGDHQTGRYRDQEIEIDQLRCLEVIVRGPAGRRAIAELNIGDSIVVLGLMRVSAPLDTHDDRDLVSVSVDAYSVGKDLA